MKFGIVMRTDVLLNCVADLAQEAESSGLEGEPPGTHSAQASAIVQPYAEAGTTWWLEDAAITPHKARGLEGMRLRIKQGPPHS